MERIDRFLATQLNISRAEAKDIIKRGGATVNGCPVRFASEKTDPSRDKMIADGKTVVYRPFVYIMMNKPKGIVSASKGGSEKTVVDLVPRNMRRKNLFPAGRLDKDTTGFVLITDDGAFAHRILSPGNHIPKTYPATLDKPFEEEVSVAFKQGV